MRWRGLDWLCHATRRLLGGRPGHRLRGLWSPLQVPVSRSSSRPGVSPGVVPSFAVRNFYSLSRGLHKGFPFTFSRFFCRPQDSRRYPPRKALFHRIFTGQCTGSRSGRSSGPGREDHKQHRPGRPQAEPGAVPGPDPGRGADGRSGPALARAGRRPDSGRPRSGEGTAAGRTADGRVPDSGRPRCRTADGRVPERGRPRSGEGTVTARTGPGRGGRGVRPGLARSQPGNPGRPR